MVQQAGRQEELDVFHEVLNDVSYGVASNAVTRFMIEAYARGAQVGCAENADFEGNTAARGGETRMTTAERHKHIMA